MSTPTNPMWAHLAALTAHPFIPELHADDCDDVNCVRCADEPTGIARLNVPAAQLADEMRALKDKAAREGLLIEQRHQYLDLDADSAYRVPGCACVACPPKGGTS